jgi:hypothetical protein
VAGADGLCGKPVREPVVGMLGFCTEHDAYGYTCRCGYFLLGPSTGVRRVGPDHRGIVHTAFRCEPGAPDTKGKEESDG